MKLGVLFSGGKDSCLALSKAVECENVACLITLISRNPESYMFHTPNIAMARMQAECIGLPIVEVATEGKKEEELGDLKRAIENAIQEFGIEGVVTGAIESVYQAERIQRVCNELGVWCFNPLWKRDQQELLMEIVEKKFNVVISGIFTYPLDEKWLGRRIDANVVGELLEMRKTYKISPSGEGGEIETTVLDAPFFKSRIEVVDAEKRCEENSGTFAIKDARMVGK